MYLSKCKYCRMVVDIIHYAKANNNKLACNVNIGYIYHCAGFVEVWNNRPMGIHESNAPKFVFLSYYRALFSQNI